ncbi:MAG: histidine kinase dimerization/phospho-acceptor domain-containing protein [Alistipes shahii]|uniref:histidine kinase dimerization/phospho-acceptor domain-containing protein n=1 Tax=Alistipes shahii TaxID=328814 RepID=UPI00399CC519
MHREQIASITRKNKLDLLEAKVSLFTEVANEIRTPVALIAAPVEEIAKRADVYGELREDVDLVRKNCERLRVLVNQILSLKIPRPVKMPFPRRNGRCTRHCLPRRWTRCAVPPRAGASR